LAGYRQWEVALRDLGECEVKHGLRLHLFNLYRDGLGNPQVPEKLRVGKSHRGAPATVRPISAPRWPRVALIVALLVSMSALLINFGIFLHRALATTASPPTA